MKKILFPLLAVITLGGCVQPLSPEVLATADFGPKPPANHQDMIKAYIAPSLIDPTSPLYTFQEPMKGYKLSMRRGDPTIYGWKVCGTVNSKNRMGGYAGKAPFYFLFKDGEIAFHQIGEPAPTGQYEISFVNGNISRGCNPQ